MGPATCVWTSTLGDIGCTLKLESPLLQAKYENGALWPSPLLSQTYCDCRGSFNPDLKFSLPASPPLNLSFLVQAGSPQETPKKGGQRECSCGLSPWMYFGVRRRGSYHLGIKLFGHLTFPVNALGSLIFSLSPPLSLSLCVSLSPAPSPRALMSKAWLVLRGSWADGSV